jgi:hypothetical protein
MLSRLRAAAKQVLPDGFVHWYRRKRAVVRFVNLLGYELYDRQIRMQLEDLEGRIAARRDGFYEQLVRDVLDRTELVVQELARRLDGQAARSRAELRDLHEEVAGIRKLLAELRGASENRSPQDRSPAVQASPADVSTVR